MRIPARLVLVAIFAVTAAGLSSAAQKSRAPNVPTPAAKPYKPVAIKPSPSVNDPGLEAFRNELAVVAKGRVYGELERLVLAQGFFWDRDFGGGFDGKRPAVDNLAAAIGLERHNGVGWATLAAFAAETTAEPFVGRPGVVCAPAAPRYDEMDFDRLLDATRSGAFEWAAPRADKTPVRAAPRSNAGIVDSLGLMLVHILEYLVKDKERDTIRTAWVRVATPTGKIGYVAPGMLMSLTAERLCYGKDGFGRWRIAGFVGGGD